MNWGLHSPPDWRNDESRAESTIVLSDSQTNIPELLGITEDGAKARLAEMSPSPDVRYAYSETGRGRDPPRTTQEPWWKRIESPITGSAGEAEGQRWNHWN